MKTLISALTATPTPTPTGDPGLSGSIAFAPPIQAALIAGLIALLSLAITLICNVASYRGTQRAFSNTVRQQELSLDREFKSKIFRDFLVQQSARSDAYSVFAKSMKRRSEHVGKKDHPDEIERLRSLELEIDQRRGAIDHARALVWESISAIQMLGSKDVLVAARKYDKAISANNPMRQTPQHLEFSAKRDLIFDFQKAARRELGLPEIVRDDMFWKEQAELVGEHQEI